MRIGEWKPTGQVYLPPELVNQLQGRLARVEGHVRGIQRMLAQGRDCDDILIQIAGVRAAIDQVSIHLLEGHLEMCVAEALRRSDGTVPLQRFKVSLRRVLE